MAAVRGHIAYQILDASGVATSFPIGISTSTGLLADMQAFNTAYSAFLDAVVMGQITKANLVIPLALAGLKAAPIADSNDEITALLSYLVNVEGDIITYNVPSWLNAGFQAYPRGNLVDLAQAAVAPFLGAMVGTTSNTKLVDEDGDTLVSLRKAVKSVRKHRKQLGRAK